MTTGTGTSTHFRQSTPSSTWSGGGCTSTSTMSTWSGIPAGYHVICRVVDEGQAVVGFDDSGLYGIGVSRIDVLAAILPP